MKFSWKISISMLVISMLVMGLGGYALLGTLFSSSWQRETRNAAEENRMLAYSFVAYWNTRYRNGRILQMKKFRKQRRPCPRE